MNKKHEHLVEIRCRKCNKLLVKKEANELLSVKCNRCNELTPLIIDAHDKQMIITDSDGKILYVNDLLMKVSGYDIHEILGSKASLLWGRGMDKNFYIEKRKTISDIKAPMYVEVDNLTKGGKPYRTSMCLSPVYSPEKEVLIYISIGENI